MKVLTNNMFIGYSVSTFLRTRDYNKTTGVSVLLEAVPGKTYS